jgi:hypothetical protein
MRMVHQFYVEIVASARRLAITKSLTHSGTSNFIAYLDIRVRPFGYFQETPSPSMHLVNHLLANLYLLGLFGIVILYQTLSHRNQVPSGCPDGAWHSLRVP